MKIVYQGLTVGWGTRLAKIFNRKLCERRCAEISFGDKASSETECDDLIWTIDQKLKPESFAIENLHPNGIRIAGGDELGLLFGIGKFLRNASYANSVFKPGPWRGTSSPAKSLRVVYCAHHFFSFYQVAPMSELKEYLEDLALWGFNAVKSCFGLNHYRSIDDEEAQKDLSRLQDFYAAAADIGLKIIIGANNVGYKGTPERLRAMETGRSFFGTEICPAKPGGMEEIIRINLETNCLPFIDNPNIHAVTFWPYDQGGCECPECRPWGVNGMLKTYRRVAKRYREYFPNLKTIYSTWLFDLKRDDDLEWRTLDERLHSGENDWIDMILADSHDAFPEYPLRHGSPGGKPIANFPELSMWGMTPWGGFGANPLPLRFQGLWGQVAGLMSGGVLYSEGIFEDFNKILYSRFYWSGNNDLDEAIREYGAFEFGCSRPELLRQAAEALENNHGRTWLYDSYVKKWGKWLLENHVEMASRPGVFHKKRDENSAEKAERSLTALEAINRNLPAWGRQAWRWRILYLRGLIDHELDHNGGEATDTCEKYFQELASIYHAAGKAEFKFSRRLSPPTREAIAAVRNSDLEA